MIAFVNGRILVSTLSLAGSKELEDLINAGAGLELFAEGPEWRRSQPGDNLTMDFIRSCDCSRTIHAPFFDLSLASENYPSIRRLTLKVYQRFLALAAELKCHYVVIHPHGYGYIYDRPGTSRRAKDSLHVLAARAKEAGVQLAVENIGYGPAQLFDAGEFIDLFSEINGIAALLDIGHAHLNGWNIPQVIRQLDKHLVSLHLHDNNGQADEHLPLGAGRVDWQPVWEALNQLPSMPYLVLEYYRATLPRILGDVRHLREILQKNAG